jgi:hypothetical protein
MNFDLKFPEHLYADVGTKNVLNAYRLRNGILKQSKRNATAVPDRHLTASAGTGATTSLGRLQAGLDDWRRWLRRTGTLAHPVIRKLKSTGKDSHAKPTSQRRASDNCPAMTTCRTSLRRLSIQRRLPGQPC